MNGIGWKCDRCGRCDVLPGFYKTSMSEVGRLPNGWYALIGDYGDALYSVPSSRHYCSHSCLNAGMVP